MEVVKRTELHRVMVLLKRWIVERISAWLGKHRRLSKDYEDPPKNNQAMIHLAIETSCYTPGP